MKAAKFAVAVLIILAIAIFANSIYIEKETERFSMEIEAIDISDIESAAIKFESLFEKFRRAEKFISITVSHDDLTNIEEGFADIIGAAKAGDQTSVITIKSRLQDSFEHLGRLSGICLDSII